MEAVHSKGGEMTPEPFLEIRGLSHAFGGLKAVSNFDLRMDNQAVWGLIGPNGAGKTTIFNLITGVYRPDQGQIRFQGQDITGLASHAIIAAGISRTFQNIRLFKSMSVLDNVRCGGYGRSHYSLWKALLRTSGFLEGEAAIREDSVSILEKFGLSERANERADALPYGQQRKIELARALLSKPRLLLLDEPGAGMNPAELDQLTELLLWVQREFCVSILLIEHRMRLVMNLCQKLKVLNFGGTIFEGLPSELTRNQAVVKAYLGEENADSLS